MADDPALAAPATETLDPRLVKAISHPLRQRIVVRLNDREASPNELATELGEPLGRVSYHVAALAKAGAIELVRTVPRRGAVEHFYRALVRPWFSDGDWARLAPSLRATIHDQNLRRIWQDVVDATRAGGFDHPMASVAFSLLELDDAAMLALSDELQRLLQRAFELQAEAAARGTETRRTELALLHFAMNAPARPGP
jgi:DNA-binding transcriptional ArsR family regulator